MRLVGLVSSYKEGDLILGALESLDQARLDDLLVFEGPAGPPLEDETIPESALDGREVTRNRWRTDARKRDAMLQEAKRRHPGGPLWGIWLDGDEVLWNAPYLRDVLQAATWADELTPDEPPLIRFPLRLIESDGRISTISNRAVRLDLIRSIDLSTSVVTNVYGIEEAWGNTAEDSRVWLDHFLGAVDRGMMTAWPPAPCEPCIVHRSHLRHPARRGLRMHVQEGELLRETGRMP